MAAALDEAGAGAAAVHAVGSGGVLAPATAASLQTPRLAPGEPAAAAFRVASPDLSPLEILMIAPWQAASFTQHAQVLGHLLTKCAARIV